MGTGVADRARDRISRLIYLDAFVPNDGQSAADVCPPGMVEALTGLARQIGEGWSAPSPCAMEQFGATDPDDVAWNERGMAMQPLKTFVEPVTLTPEPGQFPVSYVLCTDRAMGLSKQFGLCVATTAAYGRSHARRNRSNRTTRKESVTRPNPAESQGHAGIRATPCSPRRDVPAERSGPHRPGSVSARDSARSSPSPPAGLYRLDP